MYTLQTVWYHLLSCPLSAVLLGVGVPAQPIMPQGTSWLLLVVTGSLLFT